MKQIDPTIFILNDLEKKKILSIISKKDKQAYRFYKSLFKYNRIPTFFIDDILMFIEDSQSAVRLISDLKLINSTMNISKFIEIAPQCNKVLQDFQKKSFDKINNLLRISGYYRGLLIGDEPGLGKTMTSICIVKSYIQQNEIDLNDINIVVAVPLTLVNDWITSMAKSFPNAKITANPEVDANIYVVNYEKINKLNCVNSIFIVDEAHNFHNILSNRYKDLFNQVISANLVLLLTGTPIRDGILNLFALYALLDYKVSNYKVLLKLMDLLKKYYKFVYKILIKKFSRILSRTHKSEVTDNIGELSFKPMLLKIDPFLLKKNKLSIDQVDSRMSQAIDVIYNFNEKAKANKNYKAVKNIISQYIADIQPEQILDIIKKSKYSVDLKIVEQYLNIIIYNTKQSYNSKIWHTLLDDTIIFIIDHNFKNILNHISQYNKVLIVSKSRKAIQYLHKTMKANNIQGINITANDSAKDRFDKIKEFEAFSKYKYLVSTYPIIEAGVNLPFVDLIFLLDLPYRPHSLEQVINRTQRLSNLEDTITVRYLKLDYKYNILEHHYLILKEISSRVNKVLNYLEKEM